MSCTAWTEVDEDAVAEAEAMEAVAAIATEDEG